MTYAEKLRDPRWQKKRLEILERDKWRCRHCGAEDKPLHVHHAIYIGNLEPWEYHRKLLISLCERCHEQEPRRFESEAKDIIRWFRVFGWTSQNLFELENGSIDVLERLEHIQAPAWRVEF